MPKVDLHEHASFIAALGGSTKLARTLNLETKVVDNWRRRGIPWKWRPRCHVVAKDALVDPPRSFLDGAADTAA